MVRRIPETKYARADDGVYIAYQAFGRSEPCFVGAPGVISNVEVVWEDPDAARFLEEMGSVCRYIHFDKRGQGMSDRVAEVPTLEQRAADLRAVLDAEGIDRAVVGGVSEGGTTAAFLAATHPERVTGLALFGAFARAMADGDCPGATPAEMDALIQVWPEYWGTPETLSPALIAPERVDDRDWIEWVNRYERQSSTPAGLRAQLEWLRDIDIRDVLPAITVPTIVVHRAGDRLVPPSQGRWLADHIPGARYIELPGTEHVPILNVEDPVAVLQEFVTGHRPAPQAERVLATVLFTDIVGSTERACAIGDRRWREVLDRHDAMARRIIERYGGRFVKSTGDGLLATFAGPARGVQCAAELVHAGEQLDVQLRAGLHAGEVESRRDDVAGIAVHIAARVSAAAGPGEVVVSRTVKDLVAGSGISFEDRGEHELRGVPDRWQLHTVTGT